MKITDVQDLLPLVESPSRYLGTELNRIRKDPDRARLRFALAFPDLYDIGTSHFGMQILYHILNREPDIAAERVFTPADDMVALLRTHGLPLFSLETRTPLDRFDILGFSLLYELGYTNVLTMLSLAGIPFFAAERDERHPLVIAGGPCTCNPEPVAEFFDALVLGDGEHTALALAREWLAWKEAGGGDRADLLKRWAGIEGVYVPSFFQASWDDRGRQTLTPRMPGYETIRRAVAPVLETADFPDAPVVPYGRPVHDRLRLEIARGCTRGCRFCQAGMIYRPARERSPGELLALLEKALATTGYEDLSLLSLSTGDYACITPLMQTLMTRYAADKLAVSLPSLRAGTLTPELMDLIRSVRKTGFTIAPEAGSQRLRDVINKNITEEDILSTVESAFRAGWRVIKLYFMIGLPTETDADIGEMIRLVRELRQIAGRRVKGAKITVSVGIFVPKPHTPFQWHGQITPERSREIVERLRSELRGPGIQLNWTQPELSAIEGLWSRGDRRLSRLLVRAFELGCHLDGWSDHFRYELWDRAIRETGTDLEDYTTRPRDLDEPLPWDHMDVGVSRKFLTAEWRRALAGTLTPDCRSGECAGCGVCDFETVKPLVREWDGPAPAAAPTPAPTPDTDARVLAVTYEKIGPARFFGHLEMVNLLHRAIRRAGLPMVYTAGFHPMPKIAFSDPLPVGMESLGEACYMAVTGGIRPADVTERLNPLLPEGLRIISCVVAPSRSVRKPPETTAYRVRVSSGHFDETRLAAFLAAETLPFDRPRPKGKSRHIDLRRAVRELIRVSAGEIRLVMESGSGARPADVLSVVFGLSGENLGRAVITKLVETA